MDLVVAVEWVDARERLPRDGMPVAAATTGRYPDSAEPDPESESESEPDLEAEDTHTGQDFWVVMPMRFAARHVDRNGIEHHDCFIDSDGLVRLPYGRPCPDPITHWASLPTLPGTTVQYMVGNGVQEAVRHALST